LVSSPKRLNLCNFAADFSSEQIINQIKMKKLNIIVAAAIAMVTFSACKSGLQIEKPRESYVPTKMEPALSELPLKVEIDVKKLEAAVNAKMNAPAL
jgi:hypothetical protein